MKNESEAVQINKYISSSGYCSRREADKYIEQGRVLLNNELAVPTSKVFPGDWVTVDSERIKIKREQGIYIAFNKPIGITSTTDEKDKTNIIRFINHPKRIFPIGRLDKDSEGLILLTNDGDIVNKILRAGNEHEKEYIVTVNKAITPEFVKRMSSGVPVLGEKTKPCVVRQLGSRSFKIILTQGMNRQIRRMCDYLEYNVMTLKRIRVMNIALGNLPVGKWRNLSFTEAEEINRMVSGSVKTEEASVRNKKRK